MRYEGMVYRPPSEAYSLIVQATIGCSNNSCKFCEMYKDKKFRVRKLEDVLEDFNIARRTYRYIERVFLADGDALVRKTDELLKILDHIRVTIPECKRVTSYASPQSILKTKTHDELVRLHAAGLEMVYVGLESGSDKVLGMMGKGVTPAQIVEACQKVKAAGIKVSVTAISGLGGRAMLEEHAVKTAEAFTQMKPEYIGLLTLMVCHDTPLEDWVRTGEFQLLQPFEVMQETKLFLENIDSEGSVFRMNHASNYLSLKGTLNGDTPRMLREVEQAMEGTRRMRSEYMRGL
ncbi:MAG: B12-binding domain-containing radical SAM protein [Christensenellaceae bacterium]|nr:B12-binding domain-containing radical SAM protein [Christensenellaceae bacterium]